MPLVSNRDKAVLRRATYLSIPPVRRFAFWPILAAFLPVIIDLIMAWIESRQVKEGTQVIMGGIQEHSRGIDPELLANLRRAEYEVPLDGAD